MTMIKLEKLKTNLDKVPCKPRLYPTRIFALQLLTGKKLDELIDKKIIQALSKVTDFQGPHIQYKFTSENLNPSTTGTLPSTWVHQFIRDFTVYGLHEAIFSEKGNKAAGTHARKAAGEFKKNRYRL